MIQLKQSIPIECLLTMSKKTPKVIDGVFQFYDEYEDRITIQFDIKEEPQDWLDMLKTLNSLRIIYTKPKSGFKFSYSVYKKNQTYKKVMADGRIKEEHQGDFWIAHKQQNRRLNRVYIGRNENMTIQRLSEVAKEISQGKMTIKQREIKNTKNSV